MLAPRASVLKLMGLAPMWTSVPRAVKFVDTEPTVSTHPEDMIVFAPKDTVVMPIMGSVRQHNAAAPLIVNVEQMKSASNLASVFVHRRSFWMQLTEISAKVSS